jgi:hydroxymethylpyrimidine/phosphomethylpyrimidine kinase
MPYNPPAVLVFAANDPSGGAGIQADILTLASMGCHPMPVITALTIQDTTGVEDMLAMDAQWVNDQARGVLEDIPVAAFKLGVLGSVEIITAVAEILSDYPEVPLILDPVLASGRGDELANEDMITALLELIVPQTTLITPNTWEARRLALEESQEEEDLDFAECAKRILATGCEYVLVTGTHHHTAEVINTLYNKDGVVRSDSWQRLPGSFHGSGCTLASACAAAIAQGEDIAQAVREAQEYTWNTLKFGFRPGMGQYLPDRLFWAREEEEQENDNGKH